MKSETSRKITKTDDAIRLVVIDDHHVVRQGLVALLNTVRSMSVVAEGSNGEEAIVLFREHRPDVVIMDLRMPVMNGVDATIQIRREFPKARIIVLTTFDGDEDIYKALRAGAAGYLLKGMFGDELAQAIRKVHSGGSSIPESVIQQLATRITGSELTRRERDVLEGIVAGKSNREIGESLSISEATVKTHINNLLSKLGVSDRTQAVTTALQRGIVHLN